MVWKNIFKKKTITPSDSVITAYSETMKKASEIMKKYQDAILKSQTLILKQQNVIDGYKNLVELINNRTYNGEKPEFLNDNNVYNPVCKVTTISGVKNVVLRPTDIYTFNTKIMELVNEKGWRLLYIKDKKKCAKKIWDYVVENLTYEYDEGDDWRFSPVTLKRGIGDCEDGTILFLDIARESGFQPNEIFNACGWVTINSETRYGHSFPIVNCGDGWYIYETTLSVVKSSPMLFKGSKYDCSWGLGNWSWYGKLKNGDIQL